MEKKSKKIRGYLYYIFPCDIDIDKGEIKIKEGVIWFFFRWLFWITQFVISSMVENPMFVIKVYKRELRKLTPEERKNFNL